MNPSRGEPAWQLLARLSAQGVLPVLSGGARDLPAETADMINQLRELARRIGDGEEASCPSRRHPGGHWPSCR